MGVSSNINSNVFWQHRSWKKMLCPVFRTGSFSWLEAIVLLRKKISRFPYIFISQVSDRQVNTQDLSICAVFLLFKSHLLGMSMFIQLFFLLWCSFISCRYPWLGQQFAVVSLFVLSILVNTATPASCRFYNDDERGTWRQTSAAFHF